MMRVLLNALQAGNRSGTGRYATELAARLPGLAADVEVHVAWPSHLPPPQDVPDDCLHLVDSQAPLARLRYDQIGIRRTMSRIAATAVHYPANIGPMAAMRGAVLTVHDLSFLRQPGWYRWNRAAYYRTAVRRSVRTAARIIADSQATADDLQELLRVPAGRIDVIPLGVGEEFRPASAERQADVRARYQLPERFFLYVGTIEPRKNLPNLIRAWSRIASDSPEDLVIAGRPGWKFQPIQAAAASSPFANRIHFPGFIDDTDLPALLTAARAFIWPSWYEGFGLPPLEAMACGAPAVTSNTSSLPEVVADAALQVDPADTAALADAMRQAAAEGDTRTRLQQAAPARAAQFPWEQTAQLMLDAYRKLA